MRYSELTEAVRDYPLYHGTSIASLSQIISENELHSKNNWDDYGGGVSLTSDIETAEGFAKEREYFSTYGENVGAVLVFSSSDIRSNFGLRRIKFSGDGSEKEMRTANDIRPFSSHIKKIVLKRNDFENISEDHPEYAEITNRLANDARIEWI